MDKKKQFTGKGVAAKPPNFGTPPAKKARFVNMLYAAERKYICSPCKITMKIKSQLQNLHLFLGNVIDVRLNNLFV